MMKGEIRKTREIGRQVRGEIRGWKFDILHAIFYLFAGSK